MLTNNSCTYTVQVPILFNVKIEPSENTVLLLSDLEDDVCLAIDFFDTSHFPLRKARTPTPPSVIPIDVNNTPCSLPLMKLPPHGSPSPCPPLHPSSSSLRLNIVDALQLTKSRIRSKSELITIDFDNINVCDVKYLPTSFDGDIFFVLAPLSMGVSNVYGHAIYNMDKMCDGHPWCTTKITKIQNDFGLSFRRSSCVGHLQCINKYYDYMYCNGGVPNNIEWVGSTSIPFSVGNVALEKSRLKYKIYQFTPVCISLCHARIIYDYSTSLEISKGLYTSWYS